jgi:p-aminobenzoyl-glutamate transporter AbgT
MSDAHSSDAMKNLIKFMICLAILGVILALVIWYVTGTPAGIHAPLNYEFDGLPYAG